MASRATAPKRRAAEIAVAAARVFAARGYHNATTQDIADVIGVRQASLYYYFPTKEAALEQVCMDGAAGYVTRALSIVEGPGGAAAKLASIVRSHVEPLRDRADFVRVFLRERRHLPDASRRRVGRYARRYERIVQRLLEAGVASGAFRRDLDCRLATLALIDMCNGAAAWYGRDAGATIEHIGASYARLIVDGVANRSAARRRRG